MMFIETSGNTKTVLTVSNNPFGGGKVEIKRDNPCFNHAYTESISLDIGQLKLLKNEIEEIIRKNGG